MTTPPADTEEVASLSQRPSVWRTAPVDALVLLALLFGANWFLGNADPGWQRLNPTPWVLLPFFLGGRYGAAAGLVGALVAAVAVLVLQWALGNMSPQALFSAKPYYFLALLIGAAVGTLVHHLVTGPADHLRRRALSLAENNLRLSEDAALYRANEARLQEALLLHGSETVSLSGELQRLFSGDHGRFEDDLLQLFDREFGVISAAIYRDETGRHPSLSRVAATGVGESRFPEHLPSDDFPLVQAAIESGQIATWKSDWDGGTPRPDDGESSQSDAHPCLAAIPWQLAPGPGNGPRALLVIARMDFGQIRWESFARIEAVFSWCMARSETSALEGTAPPTSANRILPPAAFRERIEEAHRLESKWNLPGRLILFAAAPNAPQNSLEAFVEKLRSIVSPSDPLGAVGDGQATPVAIGLITPASSQEAGEAIARQLLSRIGTVEGTVRNHVLPLQEAARLAGNQGAGASPQSHAAAPESDRTDAEAPASAKEPAPAASGAASHSPDH